MVYDKYYSSLFSQTLSHSDVVDAGWIERENFESPSPQYYSTPLENIFDNDFKDVSVLFYPGCFAPAHEGHLQVMRNAKKELEKKGENVVAGFFSPDHNDYIMRKTHDERFTALKRIAYLQDLISYDDWMIVDVRASLFNPTDLNFTTLYDSFQEYVKYWIPQKNIKFYVVFGGDNYLFANTFTQHGHGVCIPREGYSIDLSRIKPKALERVVIGSKVVKNTSSTAIRKNMHHAADLYPRHAGGSKYFVRNDLSLAFDDTDFELKNSDISKKFIHLLDKHLDNPVIQIEEVDVRDQFQKHVNQKGFISLDCFWKGEYNLEITRLFWAAGSQFHANSYDSRSGSHSLEEQMALIPQGDYALIDDDIATGSTMNYVLSLLEEQEITVSHYESLINAPQELYDVVDMRDFVIGSQHGGLSVQSPSQGRTRVPYMFPYVNLLTRAKIPVEHVIAFSKDLWKLNYEIYKGSSITVQNIQDKQNFELFGFDRSVLISDLCLQHIKLLDLFKTS